MKWIWESFIEKFWIKHANAFKIWIILIKLNLLYIYSFFGKILNYLINVMSNNSIQKNKNFYLYNNFEFIFLIKAYYIMVHNVKGHICCPHFFPYFSPHFFPYFSPQLFPYFSIYYSVQLAYIIWHIIVYIYRARIMLEFICFYLLSMYSILVKSIYNIQNLRPRYSAIHTIPFTQYFDMVSELVF